MEEDKAHLNVQEEFKIRYYKAVDWSTKVLLKKLGSMVRDTYRALGFTLPQDYCRRKLGWSQHEIECFLSNTEIRYLKDAGADTEYKLLTKLWQELGKNVVQKVEAQNLLLQKAIYDPPVDLDEKRLYKLINHLLYQEEDLTDAVRKACHTLLEEEMLSLLQPNKEITLECRKIMHLKEGWCFLSLSRAVNVGCWRYEESSIKEHWGWILGGDLSVSENAPPDFDYLLKEVSSCRNEIKITKQLINIKQLYFDMIQRSLLRDITDALNTIAVGDIGPDLLHTWRQELQDLQQDLEGRFEALGRSECSSYKAAFGAPLVDVHRWLLTRNREPLKVNKTFWNLVNFVTGREIMLENLVEEDSQKPQVVIVYGPAGSGKTWLCHHLREEWCSGCSSLKFLRKLQLLVFLKEEDIRHESFSHHLKNVMYPRVFAGVPDSEVIKSLCRFRVCFLMDASAGCQPEFTSATSEVMRHLGQNIVIITTRPEARRDVRSVTTNFQADEVYLQPLGDRQRKDLCLNYLKILNVVGGEPANPSRAGLASRVQRYYHLRSSTEEAYVLQEDPNMAVGKFLQKLGSEERKDLFYPLSLAFLLWLWLQDPRHLNKIGTVSELFAKVISVCEQMSNENTQRFRSPTEKVKKPSGIEPVRELASLASEVFISKTYPVTSSWEKDLTEYVKFCNSLYPFLEFLKDRPAQAFKTGHFLHPFLVEVLCAWDKYRKNADRGWRGKVAPHWNQFESSGSKGSKFVTVTRLLSGFHCGDKNRCVPASYIVKQFRCVGVADDDFPAWVSLLREGAWFPSLEKAVKDVMKSSKASWRVPHANPREVDAVVQLVTHHVYLPREVIIETKAPTEVIHMLAHQPRIDVRVKAILQVSQESKPRDSLLDALQDAGNVVQFSGKIGERGASALARMTRLRTLDVHLTSLAATIAFSDSVKKLSALRDLHLHLDIDDITPVGVIPQLGVVPRRVNVYLNLYGIRDNTYKWAAEVSKKLKCCRKEIYLKNSSLSPNRLQDIKNELHPTLVHISQ